MLIIDAYHIQGHHVLGPSSRIEFVLAICKPSAHQHIHQGGDVGEPRRHTEYTDTVQPILAVEDLSSAGGC